MSVIPSENYAKLHLMMVIYPPEAKKKPGRKKNWFSQNWLFPLDQLLPSKRLFSQVNNLFLQNSQQFLFKKMCSFVLNWRCET